MKEVSQEYAILFNAITDALSELSYLEARLKLVQQTVEEIYISKEN